jgi:hypothetical protein
MNAPDRAWLRALFVVLAAVAIAAIGVAVKTAPSMQERSHEDAPAD